MIHNFFRHPIIVILVILMLILNIFINVSTGNIPAAIGWTVALLWYPGTLRND